MFPELELSISPSQGVLTTIQGLIQKALDDLATGQPDRLSSNPEGFVKVQAIITKLSEYLVLDQDSEPYTIKFYDPSGNSYVENPNAPDPDPEWLAFCLIFSITCRFQRTEEQDKELGLEKTDQLPETAEDDLERGIQVFQSNCSECHASCETRMHMLGTISSVPHSQIFPTLSK